MNLVQGPEGWQISGEGSEKARVAYACLSGSSLVYSFTPIEGAHGSLAIPTHQGANQPIATIPDSQFKHSGVTQNVSSLSPPLAVATAPSSSQVRPAHRKLRVAMVSYSFYETDNRVLRYASTLAKRGDHVDVFALRAPDRAAEEVLDGVHLHRLQGRILNEKNLFSYLWRISQFLLRAAIQVSKGDLRQRYDLLHIHSVPDFMVFSALLPRLRGTPVI